MRISDRFSGCIIGGAIGDAYGSSYENLNEVEDEHTFYPFGKPEKEMPTWRITDDTQLTIATCEAIIDNTELTTETFAHKYLEFFKQRKIRGIGASTLKALRELEAGAHWSLTGRKGEYAAGNGAAMRIAPTAFIKNISHTLIREISNITHNNDEAYVGALAVNLSIQAAINGEWTGKENLIAILIDQIPDTRLRDRLIDIRDIERLAEIGNLGNDGYVVNSVPLAIAAANQVADLGMEQMFNQLIETGGDTDTNASIAGQIAGALIGRNGIPESLMKKLAALNEFEWINKTIKAFIQKQNWEQN